VADTRQRCGLDPDADRLLAREGKRVWVWETE